MSLRYSLFTGFAVLLLALTAWSWLSSSGLSSAPDISFKTIDGREIQLTSLRGSPVLITFWATTCPGCIKEMPHLVKLYQDMTGTGFEIISVAMSYDPPNQVVSMAQRKNIPYPVSIDIDGKLAKAFDNVILTPTSFLIAPDGKIVRHKIGEMNIENLRQQIEVMLSQQKQAISYKQEGNHRNSGT